MFYFHLFGGDGFVLICLETVLRFQLSIEDLAQCKTPNGQTCFQGIQKIKSKLYLPSVEDPAPIIEDLASIDTIEVNLLSSGNFSEPLNLQTVRYIFVNFGDHTKDEINSAKLTRHDQMITRFYNELLLQKDLQIMVIFTGKRATHKKRVVREVYDPYYSYYEKMKSTNSTKTTIKEVQGGFICTAEKLLMYYISIKSNASGSYSSMNVTNVIVTSVVTSDNNTNNVENVPNQGNGTNTTDVRQADIELTVTMVTEDSDFFDFIITTNLGYWSVTNFTWNNDEILFSTIPISAADNFSFHCTPEIVLANRLNTFFITWEGLQLQPKFDSVKGQLMKTFSEANDCVGFVSPVILSGLFVTFMLLFILFIGIGCIMDIKPVARFDNPKGKTITVIADG